MTLGPSWVSISPKYRQPREGPALPGHGADGGQEDFLHAAPRPRRRYSTGLGAMVPMPPVLRPSIVCPAHACGPWRRPCGSTVLPSVKASTETSGPVQELLHHHAAAARRRSCLVLHHGACTALPGLLPGFWQMMHALAQRQTVRLDDHGVGVQRSDVGKGRLRHRQRSHSRRWECRISSSGSWQRPCCPRG